MRAAQRSGGRGVGTQHACAREEHPLKTGTIGQLSRLKRGVASISQGSLASVASAVSQPGRTPALQQLGSNSTSRAPRKVEADLILANGTPSQYVMGQGANETRAADDGLARGVGAGGSAEVQDAEVVRPGGFCAAGVEASGGAPESRILGIDGRVPVVQSLGLLSAPSDLEQQNGPSSQMGHASAMEQGRLGLEKAKVRGKIFTI